MKACFRYEVGFVLLATVLVLAAAMPAPGQVPKNANPSPKALDVTPEHFAKDASVKLDYDIVYVRAPRRGDDKQIAWTEVFNPLRAEPGSDLMLLHPNGREEVLVSAGDVGQVEGNIIGSSGGGVLEVRRLLAVSVAAAAVISDLAGPNGEKIKVELLSDADRINLARWIDLGCPIDLDYDAKHPQERGYGWMLDDQRPTLALTYPRPGNNESLTRILIGMHDYGSGLEMATFEVAADFAIDDAPVGADLSKRFKALPDNRWELQLTHSITDMPRGTLTVSIKDKQGNRSRIERTISVSAK